MGGNSKGDTIAPSQGKSVKRKLSEEELDENFRAKRIATSAEAILSPDVSDSASLPMTVAKSLTSKGQAESTAQWQSTLLNALGRVENSGTESEAWRTAFSNRR